jgi:hypothetical protein
VDNTPDYMFSDFRQPAVSNTLIIKVPSKIRAQMVELARTRGTSVAIGGRRAIRTYLERELAAVTEDEAA